MAKKENNDLRSPFGGQGAGIIYNVTIKVDAAVAGEWLHWLRTEHAPAVVSTGCFTSFTVLRLMHTDDSEGPRYAVQYRANSLAQYHDYETRFADALQKASAEKWGQRIISFRTVMEVVM